MKCFFFLNSNLTLICILQPDDKYKSTDFLVCVFPHIQMVGKIKNYGGRVFDKASCLSSWPYQFFWSMNLYGLFIYFSDVTSPLIDRLKRMKSQKKVKRQMVAEASRKMLLANHGISCWSMSSYSIAMIVPHFNFNDNYIPFNQFDIEFLFLVPVSSCKNGLKDHTKKDTWFL
jgi:hypothetical protein